MSRFVRASPFKNIYAEGPKPGRSYEALNVADVRTDGHHLACSSEFLAYADSSGGGNSLTPGLRWPKSGKVSTALPL